MDYKGKRAIGIAWRLGDQDGEVSTGTTDREEAIGVKALLLDKLKRGVIPGSESKGPGITWEKFRKRYRNEHLEEMSDGSRSAWTTTANLVERLIKPKLLVEVINKATIAQFRTDLTELRDRWDGSGKIVERKLSRNSVATYLRTLGAALNWAHEEIDGIPKPPRIRARRGLKRRSHMRSRPITGEEFDRIILAIPKVRAGNRMKDVPQWESFIRGLSLSTLRVDELRRLSWDEGAELSIDTTGRYPMIRMMAEGHKSGEDCYQPITPEFWALISKPGRQRTGYVFPLNGVRGQQMSRKAVIRIVSAFGREAGVITNTNTKKTATSHDIGRRAAITRLAASGMSMSQVQQMARHADPKTTSEFYIRHDAEKLAEAAGWNRRQCKPSAKPKNGPRRDSNDAPL